MNNTKHKSFLLTFSLQCPDGRLITVYRPWDYLPAKNVSVISVTSDYDHKQGKIIVGKELTQKELDEATEICGGSIIHQMEIT